MNDIPKNEIAPKSNGLSLLIFTFACSTNSGTCSTPNTRPLGVT